MEYALEDQAALTPLGWGVLILVLMEYALEEDSRKERKEHYERGLNPCFNGICSRRT